MSRADLLDELMAAGAGVKGGGICCPFHDDKRPSGSVFQGDDGRWRYKCHGCDFHGDIYDVRAKRLKVPLAEVLPARDNGRVASPRRKKRSGRAYPSAAAAVQAAARSVGGEHVQTWVYRYADGSEALRIARFKLADGEKTYRPIHHANDGWRIADPPGKLPLYSLPDLAAEATLFVHEGEKCADQARALGLPATTSAHGAKAAHQTAWTPVAGKVVVIVRDMNEEGLDYAKSVARLVSELQPPAKVKILALPDIGEGEDLEQFIGLRRTQGKDDTAIRREIEEMAARAPLWVPPVQQNDSGKAPQPGFHCTDLGNAERLVSRFGDELRYCHGVGWFVWAGSRWAEDQCGAVIHKAGQTVRAIYMEAAAAGDSKERRGLAEWATKSEFRARIEAMVKLAESRPRMAVTAAQLDANGFLLNVANGTIDLRTGELLAHRRDDLITKLAPVDYDPDASAPLWEAGIDRILGGDEALIRYVQRVHGMALTADISEHLLWVYHGVGANGKSLTLDTICSVMGDYAAQAPPDLLTVHRHREHPTEYADLLGRRLVVASETEHGSALRLQLVKRLTGDEWLKGRHMRQDYFQFRRTHKLILVTNNKPTVRENSEAVWRRLRLVPFSVVIPKLERDTRLMDKLRPEWPGILAWMVRGCLDWQREGLGEPPAVVAATSDYRADADTIGRFASECLQFNDSAWTPSSRLTRTFDEWCQEIGAEPEYPPLWDLLKANSCCRRTRREGRGWQGVSVRRECGDET